MASVDPHPFITLMPQRTSQRYYIFRLNKVIINHIIRRAKEWKNVKSMLQALRQVCCSCMKEQIEQWDRIWKDISRFLASYLHKMMTKKKILNPSIHLHIFHGPLLQKIYWDLDKPLLPTSINQNSFNYETSASGCNSTLSIIGSQV